MTSAEIPSHYSRYVPADIASDVHEDGRDNEGVQQSSECSLRHSEQQALTLHRQGSIDEAFALYKKIISLGSLNPLVYINAALLYRRTGNNGAAIQLLKRSLELDPGSPEANYNLGNAYSDVGDVPAAIAAYMRALSGKLDFPEALFNLGNMYMANDEIESAISCYNKALCLRPEFPEALFNLGNALKMQELHHAAIHAYQRGLALQPAHPEAWFNLGLTCYDLGHYKDAITAYQQALSLRPSFPEALFKLGNAYREAGEPQEAIRMYQDAIALNPDVAEAYFNLGIFYRDLGDVHQAIASFQQAVTRNPNYGEAHRNLALALLLIGNFKDGWDCYEWRREAQSPSSYYTCTEYWSPSDADQRLLVVGEQGVGDHVMFASMLPDLMALAKELVVQIDARLVKLFQRSMPNITFIDQHHPDVAQSHGKCIPIGSLGRYLRNSDKDFERSRTAYLSANQQRSRELSATLRKDGEILCGIAWNSVRKDSGAAKSIPLDLLAPALARSGVKLVSLQYGDVRKEIDALWRNTGIEIACVSTIDNFYDLDGLASLIDACDLVISTSNTAAHLAGALGKTTWLLVQRVPDWRWGLDRDHALWYPKMNILRQSKAGSWDDVLAKARKSLDDFLRSNQLGDAARCDSDLSDTPYI